jgi:hypothetical protein
VDGGAAGAVLSPLEPRHSRVDRRLSCRTRRGRSGDGGLVRDAEGVGFRRSSGRARGHRDEHLEPADDPRSSDRGRGVARGRGRP